MLREAGVSLHAPGYDNVRLRNTKNAIDNLASAIRHSNFFSLQDYRLWKIALLAHSPNVLPQVL